MNKQLGPKILELRKQGKSYNEIVSILKCAKSTVCFHLANGQKNKNNKRNYKNKKKHPYINKLYCFRECKKKLQLKQNQRFGPKEIIYKKIIGFCAHKTNKGNISMCTFTVQDVIDKFGENPVCYLTGKSIDIYQPRTYQFDHKIPRSKGGDNSLDNLGICTKQVNQSKTDMTPEEYIELCKKVLIHNGYSVNKHPDTLKDKS